MVRALDQVHLQAFKLVAKVSPVPYLLPAYKKLKATEKDGITSHGRQDSVALQRVKRFANDSERSASDAKASEHSASDANRSE